MAIFRQHGKRKRHRAVHGVGFSSVRQVHPPRPAAQASRCCRRCRRRHDACLVRSRPVGEEGWALGTCGPALPCTVMCECALKPPVLPASCFVGLSEGQGNFPWRPTPTTTPLLSPVSSPAGVFSGSLESSSTTTPSFDFMSGSQQKVWRHCHAGEQALLLSN